MSRRTLLRILAWAILVGIVLATLLPLQFRPHSGLSVQWERTLAFAVAGFLMALAYPRHILLCAALVLGAAVMLEVLQLLTPSRHGRALDLLVKLLGASSGILAAWAVHRIVGRWLPTPSGRHEP